ncbi:acylphosphatase [Methanococcoides seepicolus]|uniref:acylphosphatase n=1 Tax=Methanococcoides seepicolus TaxID=2828780 RepID=UPI002032316E|nr:acylphosphatase [Methanococcoides seepicolus]
MAGGCKRILVRGVVQGVGFRPFIYRIAKKYGLHGYVRNTGGRVEIVVEGNMSNIDRFLYDLNFKNPPRSKIDTVEVNGSINSNYRDFSILDSRSETTPDSIMI